MAIKKQSVASQLRAAKVHIGANKIQIANLEKENADLRRSWMEELTARSRESRELELAYAQGIKLKGVVEYLEGKLKDD
jgi:hypothetical protein